MSKQLLSQTFFDSKICLTLKIFVLKISYPKTFLFQKSVDPQTVFGGKYLGGQQFGGTLIFAGQQMFWTKMFGDQKFVGTTNYQGYKNVRTTIFRSPNLFGQQFTGVKKFLRTNIFRGQNLFYSPSYKKESPPIKI